MKITISIIVAVVLIVSGVLLYNPSKTVKVVDPLSPTSLPDVKNMKYNVGGETFTLKNGKDSKDELEIFGEPKYGDLDSDGDVDAAVYLVNKSKGTGIFYYAVLVLNNDGEFTASNPTFLGDRIAPQNVIISQGRAVFNFAERKADEPMSAEPSVGKSVWINYDVKTNDTGEWVKGFEGETNW